VDYFKEVEVINGCMIEQTSASELFRAAYENRYTWDENFPGYSADVQLQGHEVYTGIALTAT